MNVLVLTTDTPHHTFFVRELAAVGHDVVVISEHRRAVPAFPTTHPFEDERERHEIEQWFGGNETELAAIAEVIEVESCNDRAAIEAAGSHKPDLIVDFGTGRITAEMIRVAPDAIVNLHGGDPERYRGLDSHLWAIYHRDFEALSVTAHRLNTELDDGDIVLQGALELAPGVRIHELRRLTTEMCVQLTAAIVGMLERDGTLISRPQRERGRYYSFMPAVLKELCVERFDHHVRGLS